MGRGGRIGPACAGKSLLWIICILIPTDHPRMCGEKSPWYTGFTGMAGSPPHVRGKEDCAIPRRLPLGITPACAGKRSIGGKQMTKGEDHPRMCGEKGTQSGMSKPTEGSPPHVRGKALSGGGTVSGRRITPACAGKSFIVSIFTDLAKDHPRMCGEKTS